MIGRMIRRIDEWLGEWLDDSKTHLADYQTIRRADCANEQTIGRTVGWILDDPASSASLTFRENEFSYVRPSIENSNIC